MKKITNFIVDMYSSSEGVSHKRVFGSFGFLCLIAYMFMYKSERAIEAVEYISIAYGIGTVAEKFTKNGQGQTNTENN
jgi:hypothetical protein